jgi:hypothetical protein
MSKVAVKFIMNMVYILQRVMLFMTFNATLVIYANNVNQYVMQFQLREEEET